jgi:hypothetical protein
MQAELKSMLLHAAYTQYAPVCAWQSLPFMLSAREVVFWMRCGTFTASLQCTLYNQSQCINAKAPTQECLHDSCFQLPGMRSSKLKATQRYG